MEASEIVALALGSAAVGAVASSIVTGLFTRALKKAELDRQDIEMAMKLTELRHQQGVALMEWNHKRGRFPRMEVWDPLMSMILYRDGMEEYRRTGHWTKGEEQVRAYRERQQGAAGSETQEDA